MKRKKVPMRMCIGCKDVKPKKELIRIVKNKENEIFVDFTGKKNGRGAYICNNISCLENTIKTKKLERIFEDTINPEIYELLRKQMEGNNGL
ncbi:MAG: YlxR family protein [Clostridiaceae bacterium]|nr:YlxR family protein [Clostridiaceae bacterium]